MSTPTSLTMIVKNEAVTLPSCLASVQGLVDEIIAVQSATLYASSFLVLTGVEMYTKLLEDLP